jgi:hypothetical protein
MENVVCTKIYMQRRGMEHVAENGHFDIIQLLLDAGAEGEEWNVFRKVQYG